MKIVSSGFANVASLAPTDGGMIRVIVMLTRSPLHLKAFVRYQTKRFYVGHNGKYFSYYITSIIRENIWFRCREMRVHRSLSRLADARSQLRTRLAQESANERRDTKKGKRFTKENKLRWNAMRQLKHINVLHWIANMLLIFFLFMPYLFPPSHI